MFEKTKTGSEMGDTDDTSTLFNHIIGDMKNTTPLWEDLLLKASKFYGAVKQTAITADLFLDAFQKIADATTNSKGGTKDIGVAFTKIVMRHKAIESKLKTYVGILADNFVSPLQECLDDWKRCNNQLEKDHTKDYKRLKTELKRANSDSAKLKKKASKKMGKQEYTEQYREAMKISNLLTKALEEQEKAYLRKVMTDEIERAAEFFDYYKPCVVQELTLVNEIDKLQSILDEATILCANPRQLPVMSEDAITGYKVPEALAPDREASTGTSPPSSPVLVRDRSLNMANIPSTNKGTLSRSQTTPCYNTDLDPVAVSIPTPTWSSDSVSSRSSRSSLSSLEQVVGQPMHDPITLQELHVNQQTGGDISNGHVSQQNQQSNDLLNMHPVLKTRSSWSSSETTDSSGIGSYHSLNSTQQHQQHNNKQQRSSTTSSGYHRSGSETDVIEVDYLDDYDERNMFPTHPIMSTTISNHHGYQQQNSYQQSNYQQNNYQNQHHGSIGFHQGSNMMTQHANANKYATIDRSHFKRNQLTHQNNFQDSLKQRSNSLGENTEEEYPSFPDYKMNLPKPKMNTISGSAVRTLPNHGRQNIFQVFEGHDPSQLLKKLSPTNSPFKKIPPPTPQRRNSTPVGPQTAPKPVKFVNRSQTSTMPRRNTIDNEPVYAKPGSFEASLQQQRMRIKQRSYSVDQSACSNQAQFQDATKF